MQRRDTLPPPPLDSEASTSKKMLNEPSSSFSYKKILKVMDAFFPFFSFESLTLKSKRHSSLQRGEEEEEEEMKKKTQSTVAGQSVTHSLTTTQRE